MKNIHEDALSFAFGCLEAAFTQPTEREAEVRERLGIDYLATAEKYFTGVIKALDVDIDTKVYALTGRAWLHYWRDSLSQPEAGDEDMRLARHLAPADEKKELDEVWKAWDNRHSVPVGISLKSHTLFEWNYIFGLERDSTPPGGPRKPQFKRTFEYIDGDGVSFDVPEQRHRLSDSAIQKMIDDLYRPQLPEKGHFEYIGEDIVPAPVVQQEQVPTTAGLEQPNQPIESSLEKGGSRYLEGYVPEVPTKRELPKQTAYQKIIAAKKAPPPLERTAPDSYWDGVLEFEVSGEVQPPSAPKPLARKREYLEIVPRMAPVQKQGYILHKAVAGKNEYAYVDVGNSLVGQHKHSYAAYITKGNAYLEKDMRNGGELARLAARRALLAVDCPQDTTAAHSLLEQAEERIAARRVERQESMSNLFVAKAVQEGGQTGKGAGNGKGF